MKNFPFHCDLKKMANSRLRNGVGAQCSPLKRYLHSSPIIDAKYIPMVDILSVWSLFWSLVGKLWGWTTRIKGTSSFLRYPLYYSSVCHPEILYGDEWGSNGKLLLKYTGPEELVPGGWSSGHESHVPIPTRTFWPPCKLKLSRQATMGEPLRIFLLHMMNLSNLHTWKCKEIELDPFLLCCTLVCTAEKYIGNGRILLCFLPRLSSPKCQLLNQQSSVGISYIPRPANATVSDSQQLRKLVKAGDITICK